jgi:hypothetical protein
VSQTCRPVRQRHCRSVKTKARLDQWLNFVSASEKTIYRSSESD